MVILEKIIKFLFNEDGEFYKYYVTKYEWFKNRKAYKKNPDDKMFALEIYKEKKGKLLDLTNPTTFDEKVWWLKLNYRNDLQTIVSDKVLVRDYITNLGLKYILNDIYGVYNNAKDIKLKSLPNECYIKANHVSGTNFYYNKDRTKRRELFFAKKRFNYVLKQNYYLASREWNYKNIVPKIIVEKVLHPTDQVVGLIDYRFFCSNGKVVFIFVDIDTADDKGSHSVNAKRNVYTPDFEIIDVVFSRKNFDKNLIKKPINFQEMVDIAEKLSKPFPFVRIDLYNINGKIIFGEFTFHHAGGVNKVTPEKYQKIFGDLIDLPELL